MANYIGITKRLRVITEPVVDTNFDTGPYESIDAANLAIPSALRTKGKYVIITTATESYMAMWKHGIEDTDLVELETAVSGEPGGSGEVLYIMDSEVVDHEDYFSTTYGGQAIGTKVVDTVYNCIYEKVNATLWIKTFGVAVGTDVDTAAVIEGINIVNYK